jgi:hypothetical protein
MPVEAPVRTIARSALQPIGRQRSPSPRIAVARGSPVSGPDGRDGDECECDRPADPDGCAEHVQDDERDLEPVRHGA